MTLLLAAPPYLPLPFIFCSGEQSALSWSHAEQFHPSLLKSWYQEHSWLWGINFTPSNFIKTSFQTNIALSPKGILVYQEFSSLWHSSLQLATELLQERGCVWIILCPRSSSPRIRTWDEDSCARDFLGKCFQEKVTTGEWESRTRKGT